MNIANGIETIKFYDNRYDNGYMDEWPAEKKQRVYQLIKNLNLPENGNALDFGCGNGIFTNIIKQALPKWEVYGIDISSIAIENANKRYPHCSFYLSSKTNNNDKRFDFLFTHHVLEHVCDLPETFKEINNYLKEKSSILHILPCGNKGSFEHGICLLNKNGINTKVGNKFVFEDISHLRRLDTKQMNDYAGQYGFSLCVDYYCNQFFGAFDWITLLSPALILEMTSPKNAKDKISALKLTLLSIIILTIKIARFPSNTIDYNRERMKSSKYYFLFIVLLIFYPLSKLTNICLKHMSNSEWKDKKNSKNGSEMYLYYKRS